MYFGYALDQNEREASLKNICVQLNWKKGNETDLLA